MHRFVLLTLILPTAGFVAAQESKTRLLIAFGSYRDRPKHPNIFFYEHDGVGQGKIVGTIATPRNVATAEAHPWLTADGRLCFFTFEQENKTSRIHCWDRQDKKLLELPEANTSPNTQLSPSCSADGNLVLFTALNRPMGAGQGYHVYLFDRSAKKVVDLPGLNDPMADDRMAKTCGTGRCVVFVSNRKGGAGLTDVYLYDRTTEKLVDLPGLNSDRTDVEPALGAEGNLIAFASDRSGGKGSRDIYLYDRRAKKLLDLPGLNGPGPEYTPTLSPDGRFLAFVAERVGGEGERDIFLYDRQTARLLPTPGLNSKTEDFDPCVLVMPTGK